MSPYPTSWRMKFSVAISGLVWAAREQTSFHIHLPMTLAVIAVAGWLQVELWRWAALLIAITVVITAELLNTAIEQLVKVLHPEHDEGIGRALDVAAAAVLIASLGAVIVGVLTLAMPLLRAVGIQ